MADGEDSDRIESLELAVTQLADAVEGLVLDLLAQWPRLGVQPVLEQVAHARRLIGTEDDLAADVGDPSGPGEPPLGGLSFG